MNSRVAFVICSPLLTAVGAATTVIAPMLLNAASFTRFALLTSIFTYLSEFDLGLARLSDRLVPNQSNNTILIGSLLFVRYWVAAVLLAIGVCVSDPIMLVAWAGGVAMLLANGPWSIHRARSNIRTFTFATFLLQFGMTLPRLLGLLVDGVRGSMIGLGLWTGLSCIILNVPMIGTVRAGLAQFRLIPQAIPLFLYNGVWLMYLFANRWISWWVSDTATDAGLFAFGANLSVAVLGVIMVLSQPFYPRHLETPNPSGLARELYLLLGLGTIGGIVGNILCWWALGVVFPHFIQSASATGALLIATIPLGLGTWLVPLVIARSEHPYEVIVFPPCLLLMYGLMVVLNRWTGIDGQAWACVPPALLLFAVQLALVTRNGLLDQRHAVFMWIASLGVSGVGAIVWSVMFL